jgi:G:T/U-mismatch repair DNA glycosylase
MPASASTCASTHSPVESVSSRATLNRPGKFERLSSARTTSPRPKKAKTEVETDPTVSRDWLTYVAPGLPRARIVFIGHNPSEMSWDKVAPYANPTNAFWKILAQSGLASQDEAVPAKWRMLAETRGIVFGDLWPVSGSDSSKVDKVTHGAAVAADVTSRMQAALHAGPPRAVVLVSKSVGEHFLGIKSRKLSYGRVGMADALSLPWLSSDTQIWLVPSTSGRAVLSFVDRLAPYKALADAAHEWPWIQPFAMDHDVDSCDDNYISSSHPERSS